MMISDPRLLGAVLRSDFYSFVQAIFPIVSPNAAFVPNWHIEAIANALTRVLNGEIKRLIITVPPRNLKSICASVAFPAFVLGHDPTKRIIGVSYSEGLACKHANDCRAVMRSAPYRRLFPNTRISSTKNTELEFATTRGGNRLATSVGGTLTGRGGNFVIIDDPMKPQEAYSEAARDYALLIENKGSGMSLIQDLERDNIHAIGVDPEGDKVMRMNAQTARIEAGSVFLPRQAPCSMTSVARFWHFRQVGTAIRSMRFRRP
jgi:hypothetical protein